MNRLTLLILALASMPLAVSRAATLGGTVSYEGPVPRLTAIPGAKCHTGAADIVPETVVLSKNNQLKNVVVYLEGTPTSDGASLPALTLDQKDCRYTPHVVALQVNQPLVVTTSDPTIHNVHYNPDQNSAANFALIEPGQKREVKFKEPEFFKVTCDVHAWMTAWVAVFDHSFFSVTDENGAFQIRNIPAGTYKLISWHERFGKREKIVNVTDGDLTSDFVYKPPQ
jgi:hypothetical protein